MYYDGTYSSPVRTAPYRLSAPFASNEFCVLEADYRQTLTGFAAATGHPTMGSVCPFKAGFYCVKVGEPRTAGPTVEFTITWAKIPASFSLYETHAYTFIGYWGASGINAVTVEGRKRLTKTVNSRLLHEFFLCIAGQTYTTPTAIPINYAQRYRWNGTENDTDYLADNPPFTQQSSPGRATYEGWIAAKTEIVAQDSSLKQWMGPMYMRITRYVVAQ